MEKLSKMESFESFQISKQSMNQIVGSRTVSFHETSSGQCAKRIDTDDGEQTNLKLKPRYADKC